MNLEFAADDRLYQMAIILVAGIVGGELVGRIHLPKVTGWIFTGVLLRARGILTRTLIAAVALIDMIAVGAFVFVTDFLIAVGSGDTPWHESWQPAIGAVAGEFGLALGVGTCSAVVALVLTRTIVGPAFLGPTMVAVILGAWAGAEGFGGSGILACTCAGIMVSNLRHDTVRSTEAYLHSIGGVLFAAFYTFAGMKLDFTLVVSAAGLVALFFVSRFAGKYVGAYVAMSLANVPSKVRNNFGLALMPHGGVAVGLIILVQNHPNLQDVAEIVTTVALAALAINELLGPSAARFALNRAGEAGKDLPRLLDFLDEHHIAVDITGNTREDVIRSPAARLYTTKDRPSISQAEFVEKVFERELVATTCLSEGLMVPHAILEEGQMITGVLGVSSKGLNLDAPDGKPIHAVLSLATPETDRKRHLEVLSAFATTITRNMNLREQLYHARSAAHAYDVLHADEAVDINYCIEDAMSRVGVYDKTEEVSI